MNILFSPSCLWPIPVLLIFLSWLWERFARVGKARHLPWRFGLGIFLALLGAWDLLFFSLPPTRGQVLDLKTGRAIPNAKVQRSLYRQRPFTLEQFPVTFVKGSFLETSTDAEGNFTLPGWLSAWPRGLGGLCGMAWLVYTRDYMPAYGCWADPFGWRARGCAAFATPQYPDPWARFVGRFTTSRASIQVATAQNDSPEAWAEAFQRMNYLLQDKRIQVEEFVEVAVVSAKKTALTEALATELYKAAFQLGQIQPDGTYFKAREGLTLILLVDSYCRDHPESKFCSENRRSVEFRKNYFAEAAGPG